MEEVACLICGGEDGSLRFEKASPDGSAYRLVRCRRCGLEFISPRPCRDEIGTYYREAYFAGRTDRGYDDYFAGGTRREIERVMELNLRDLGFRAFERSLPREKRVLDIGCAAGYFLMYLHERGWDATGVDISPECVAFARGAGLAVYEDDYLEITFARPFNLITFWASIEHMHHPDRFLEKARDELADGGRLYISTCRSGGANFMRLFGSRWRYYNFPEHLYFFSRGSMRKLLEMKGFRVTGYATYGSGFGAPGTPLRRAADLLAKRCRLGDMMLIAAGKA